ncbi:FAD-dependent oxidoreductase [Desulforamulus aeronauticus]|uniref:Dehydrogenase (Flavoprotein) n=1 Tax=Desulforamulus aeronauticus DSM 10349 TaxID=1121421 RepID=A0A1M6RZ13_9FIRM|nr:FAD-dependent oxidoreductase [Desulforamulus aeronauticus]SHK37547.1 Dehydrogenase (flavoprotein) [Desulforamulus aeronauticus DSM 10349]
MKIAIIGAGLAGLSAALTLEKNGFIPDVYEQNSLVADHYSHVGVVLNMAYRSISLEPLKYLNKLLTVKLSPLETINNLIINSQNSQASVKNEIIGHSFVVGPEPNSLQNQILKHIKNSKMLYEQRESLENLRQRYDYVIVASGSRSEDYVADKYLKGWHQYLVAYSRVAKIYGKFEPNTAIVWGDKEILKDGYAFLAPFSRQIASLYVTVPHVSSWAELDQIWKAFFKKEGILEKYTLLGTFERTHVSAYSSSVTWENCLFAGDQGCFLDPFLGLGAATAIVSGVMAARAIIENSSYDKLVQEHKKVISVMSKVRNFYDSIDDKTFDFIVTSEDNAVIKKLIYGTTIDWLKYGSKALGPFLKQKKSPNVHDTFSSPAE